jgi:16S rRNA A1518/A1519 N6-dimethyltransferase RsmA/KsgA/DIM1 with predicted DNA glycosylase/AP lyase activity
MSIHPSARRGFAAAAEVYERARPDYPRLAVSWLVRRLRIGASSTVIDLGAGTGKLTRPLAETGATVIALEPVAEMRAHLSRTARGVEVLDGRAEAIPFPAALPTW